MKMLAPTITISLSNFSDQNEELCVLSVCVCVGGGMGWFQKNLLVFKWVLSACCGNGLGYFWFYVLM